jgi:hypothetical protein
LLGLHSKDGNKTGQNRRRTGHLPIDKKGKPLDTPRKLIRDNRRFPEAILKALFPEDSPAIPVSELNESGPSGEEQKNFFHVEINHGDYWSLFMRTDC